MRRFLKAKSNKKRDISEGEFKRLENMLNKMAKKQKTLLLESAETLTRLSEKHSEELQILTSCFRHGNDISLFKISNIDDHEEWLEQFMDIMTPWAEWYEAVNGPNDEIYYLDVFWEVLETSECLALMLRLSCIVQELELTDGQLLRFLDPYDVELLKSPWYEYNIADHLLHTNPWIGEMMFAEQLFTPENLMHEIIAEAVLREKQNTKHTS